MQFPPSKNLSSRVSLLLLYGTCLVAPPFSHSALMQFPKARRDSVILAPSTIRWPILDVAAARLLPARSIIDSVTIVHCSVTEAVRGDWVTCTCRTGCDREEVSFALVGLRVRRVLLSRTISLTSSAVLGLSSVRPTTLKDLSSRIRSPPRAWLGKEISDLFVVNFERGDHGFDVPFVFAVLDALEEVCHC